MGNGYGIMPLDSPGGSTLQWGTRQDLLCLAVSATISWQKKPHSIN